MTRKNSFSDQEEQELNELIASYEAAKAENKQLYLDGDQLADIADKYAGSRRFDEAQEVINYGLELHPGQTDLLVQQAYLYLDTMEVQKAKKVVESITETYESDVKLLKAEILLNESRLDEAEKLLDSIEDKEALNIILDVSYLYIDMGYPEKALPWLKRGLEEYNDKEEFLAAVADCYCTTNKHNKEAIFFYNKLIDKNPYNPTYWTGLAKCHFAQQEFDKTVEACDFALAADENFGEAHILKAHSLFHLDNETEAIREYQLAIKSHSLPPEVAHLFIGLAYANQEKWEQSYQSYEQALELIGDEDSPFLPEMYCNEAFCLTKLGKYEEAHQVCDKAKEKLAKDAGIYIQEGRIYLEEGKFEEAKECWRVAVQYAPQPETWVEIANHNLFCSLFEEARFCFEQARKLNPDFPEINIHLASICLLLKDHEGFHKYNQLTGHPLNVGDVREAMPQDFNVDAIAELEEFIQKSNEFQSENGNEENDNEEENKL